MAISLGTQEFVGSGNFPIAMVAELATQLTGKNITATLEANELVISQGGSEIGRFDLSHGSDFSWSDVAGVLFSNASVQDVHDADRINYSDGFSRGIDWRDMSQNTDSNSNRFIDSNLSISVDADDFTVSGFGNSLQKLVSVQLQRNDAATGEGALIQIADGVPFMRVDTSNHIQINTVNAAGGDGASWSSFSDGSGLITLAAGSNNYLVFGIYPRGDANTYETVAALYNGSTYTQLNNINFTVTTDITGDELVFSRSTEQRGQVISFKAINIPRYISHSATEDLIRNHRDDRWCFGYSTVITGGTFKEVDFTTRVNLPAGSTIAGFGMAGFRSATSQPLPDVALGNAMTGTGILSGAATSYSTDINGDGTDRINIVLDNSDSNNHRLPTGASYNTTTGELTLPTGHYRGNFRCTINPIGGVGIEAQSARSFPIIDIADANDIILARFNAYIRYASNAALTGTTPTSNVAYVDIPFNFVTDGTDTIRARIGGQAQTDDTTLHLSQCRLEMYRI